MTSLKKTEDLNFCFVVFLMLLFCVCNLVNSPADKSHLNRNYNNPIYLYFLSNLCILGGRKKNSWTDKPQKVALLRDETVGKHFKRRWAVKRTAYVPVLSLAWRGRWYSVDRHHLNTLGGGGPDSHRHLPERNKVLDEERTMLDWIKSQLSRFVFETCAILMFSLHRDTSNLFCSRISEQHHFIWGNRLLPPPPMCEIWSQQHMLVMHKQTQIQAVLVSLMVLIMLLHLIKDFSTPVLLLLNINVR